nr:hypothetical protein [uncultured Lichenicoccus sp.]
MSDPNSNGTLSEADIATVHLRLSELVSRGWFALSTVVDHNGPGDAEYQYLAVDQIAGPPIAVCFHLGKSRQGGYNVTHIQNYDAPPFELPKASTAREAADRINELVATTLKTWGLRAA